MEHKGATAPQSKAKHTPVPPKLLSALRRASVMVEEYLDNMEGTPFAEGIRMELEKINAAIAEAEGGAR